MEVEGVNVTRLGPGLDPEPSPCPGADGSADAEVVDGDTPPVLVISASSAASRCLCWYGNNVVLNSGTCARPAPAPGAVAGSRLSSAKALLLSLLLLLLPLLLPPLYPRRLPDTPD